MRQSRRRHWGLARRPTHWTTWDLQMLTLRLPHLTAFTRTTSSTYNFLTICKLLLSPNCGVDPFTPFYFMVLLNTSHQTPRILKFRSTSWPNIYKVNKSTVTRQMISAILMVWEMQYGISSHPFMCLSRMCYILTAKLIRLDQKYCWNSLLVFPLPMVIQRRILPNLFRSRSTKPCPLPLFRPNPRKR